MNVIKTDIEGVVIVEPDVFGDARGYFFESWSQAKFDAAVRPVRFVRTTRASRVTAYCAASTIRRDAMRSRNSYV